MRRGAPAEGLNVNPQYHSDLSISQASSWRTQLSFLESPLWDIYGSGLAQVHATSAAHRYTNAEWPGRIFRHGSCLFPTDVISLSCGCDHLNVCSRTERFASLACWFSRWFRSISPIPVVSVPFLTFASSTLFISLCAPVPLLARKQHDHRTASYQKAILEGREPDSTERMKKLGLERSGELAQVSRDFFVMW